MAKRKPASGSARKPRSALTPEARENQLIAKAYDLVEQRLDDGTATSQETTHFLKLGSAKARLEMRKIEREIEVLAAKKDAYESSKRIEELYEGAMKAMRTYNGISDDED